MNKKALVVALIVTVVGAALLQLYMARFRDEVSGGETVTILIARKDIKPGSILTKQMIAVYPIPSKFRDPRHIAASDQDRIIGTRVRASVKVSGALLWSDLAMMRETDSLADLVQEGMRAATISAPAFSGLLRPGDRVDVLLVRRDKTLVDENGNQTTVVPILQNILVLAVGASMERESEAKASGGVTLSLSLEQTQLLSAAKSTGSLELVLRNTEDMELRGAVQPVTGGEVRDPAGRAKYLHAQNLQEDAEKSHVE